MGVVVHAPNPFNPADRQVHAVKRPMTVRRVVGKHPALRRHTSVRRIGGRRVREFDRATVCFFNGKPLLRQDWKHTVVTEADAVFFFAPPAGGNAGSQILTIVLAVAVAVAAPYLAGLAAPLLGAATGISFAAGTIAGGLLTAGIGIALSAAAAGIMSLFAQPPPQAQNYSSGYAGTSGVAAQTSPTYSSSGFSQNSARLGQPIPVLHGRHMVVPDYAMPPIIRYEGNKQFISAFLIITQGNCNIEQVRIGETPISSYASIVYEKVEPGVVPNPAICDVRLLPCRDIADVELPDSTASPASPWKGPFAANPPGTVIDWLEVDHICPRGLYRFNTSAGFDARSVTVEVQAQQLDAAGEPVGGWLDLDPITISAADSAPQRVTTGFWTPSPGRWQVRERRTDAKDTAANAGHQVSWAGLRGRLTTDRKVAGVTGMVIKMEVNGDLNGSTSRQVNVVAQRTLPTYDFGTAQMGTAEVETRGLCDAFVDIVRNTGYGGRKPDNKIDLAGIYAHQADFAAKGWEFNFVWDQSVTEWEALGRVARACISERIVQGQKLRLVRDLPTVGAVMMFTPRNIRPDTFEIEQKLIDDTTSDGLTGTFMDTRSWRPDTITEAFDDSPQMNLSTVALHGVTVRSQAREMLWNLLRANRYRRRIVGFGTEAEGLMVLYGDGIAVSHDMPKWGQSAEALKWDAASRTMTLSEEMTFTPGGTHYIAVRNSKGELVGPFTATKVGDDGARIVVGPGTLPSIYTGNRKERTLVQFGLGESYAKRLKVIGITPRSDLTAQVLAIADDPRMYDPIPAEEETPPPIGAPIDPLDIHVTANTSILNLRSKANASGWTGNPAQAVTITIDPGVHVVWAARGTWPAGFQPTLINQGTISGADGAPGVGGEGGQGITFGLAAFSGGTGGTGGTALDASSGPLKVDNSAGTIRGGRGGGGGGGGGGGAYHETLETSGDAPIIVGHPMDGGAGGAGNGGVGAAGMTDGIATGGTGGTGGALGAYASAGSNGGAGSPGSGGTTNYDGAVGGAGGPGGAAVTGNANITWVGGTGTRVGAIL
jgi:hypothetical protein